MSRYGMTIFPYDPFFHRILKLCYERHPDIDIEAHIPGTDSIIWANDEPLAGALGDIHIACPLEMVDAIRRHHDEAWSDHLEEQGELIWDPAEAPEYEFDCYLPW